MTNSITRKSRLIRGAIYLFLALAALAALALVWEGVRFRESMPDQSRNSQLARIAGWCSLISCSLRCRELLLFDINRMNRIAILFKRSFEKAVFPKLERTDLPYTLSMLKNADCNTNQLVIQSRDGHTSSEKKTDLYWP